MAQFQTSTTTSIPTNTSSTISSVPSGSDDRVQLSAFGDCVMHPVTKVFLCFSSKDVDEMMSEKQTHSFALGHDDGVQSGVIWTIGAESVIFILVFVVLFIAKTLDRITRLEKRRTR